MKNVEELLEVARIAKSELGIREADTYKYKINIAMSDCGIQKGAKDILHAILKELAESNEHEVAVIQTDCMGMCNYEPTMEIIDNNGKKSTYMELTPQKAVQIVKENIINKGGAK